MIIRVRQLVRGYEPEYRVENDVTGAIIGKARTKHEPIETLCLMQVRGTMFNLRFVNPQVSNGTYAGEEPTVIMEGQEPVGEISSHVHVEKHQFFGSKAKNYKYYDIVYEGINLKAYKYNLGENGLSFAIYNKDTNEQIAAIEESDNNRHQRAEYVCYIKDKDYVFLAALFSVYVDFEANPNVQVLEATSEEGQGVTRNTKLLDMYGSAFGDYIREVKDMPEEPDSILPLLGEGNTTRY